MNNENVKTYFWASGDLTICLSTHHKDMHIVNHPDGKYHSLTASNDYMLTKYPPNVAKK